MTFTFAQARRQAVIDCVLSPTFGAEDVAITHRGQAKTCRVNVQQAVEADPKPLDNADTTLDEMERLRVVFLRDDSWEFGGIATKPNVGESLVRPEANDADQTPFSFTGRVEREDAISGTYIYERPRRSTQGRRL